MKYLFFLLILLHNFNKVYAQDWLEHQKIVAPERMEFDGLGSSISTYDNEMFIGVTGNDSDNNGLDSVFGSGAVFVYKKDDQDNWNYIQKITASDRQKLDFFGESVSVHENLAVVGADREDHNVTGGDSIANSGAAYIFMKDSLGNWNEIQKIVPSNRTKNAFFGRKVVINYDQIIVTAPNDEVAFNPAIIDQGAVYVFEKNNVGVWEQVQRLKPNDPNNYDYFGFDIATFEDQMVVGTPGKSWGFYSDNGAAYVFMKNSEGKWVQEQKLVQIEPYFSSTLGYSVSIHGSFIALGAPFRDQWTEDSVRIYSCGAAFLFQKQTDGSWEQIQKVLASDYGNNGYFGNDISMKGSTLLIGSYKKSYTNNGDEGAAYVFHKQENDSWQEIKKLVSSDLDPGDKFGSCVHISNEQLLIGVPSESEDIFGNNPMTGSGAVYCFNYHPDLVKTQTTIVNEKLIIYPNPNNGKFTVKLPSSVHEGTISILNAIGHNQVVTSFDNSTLLKIDLNNLQNGLYYIEIITNNRKIVEPFIISE